MEQDKRKARTRRIYMISVSICAVFALLFIPINFWYKEVGYWYSYVDYKMAISTVCEFQALDAVIRQPLSTFTNVFYLLFGIEILMLGFYDRANFKLTDNLLKVNYAYSITFGISFIFLFFASSLYHASMLDFFSKLDMAGVYACTLFPLFFNLHRLVAAIYYKNRLYFSYIGTIITLGTAVLWWLIFTNYFSGFNSYYVIPVILLCMVGATTYYNWYYVKKSRADFILISGSCAVVATLLYWVDPYFCTAESYFQLHAIWHIFSAFAMYYYYWFLRSEQALEVGVVG